MRNSKPYLPSALLFLLIAGLVAVAQNNTTSLVPLVIPGSIPSGSRQGSTGTKVFICTGTFTTGNVITTDSNGNCIDGGATPVGGGLISYSSAVGLTLTANTYFFPLGGGGAPSTTATDTNTLVEPIATVSNLGVSISAAFGMGNSGVFTVRDITAASDSSITCTISGASAVSCSDTSHSFATVAGHFYAVKLVTTGTISVTPVVTFSLQFGSVGAAGVVGAGTANQTAYYPATGTRVTGGGPGTAGQCWTSNGAGSAPTFQACGGGGGSTPITFVQAVSINGTNIAPSMTVVSGSLLISVGMRNSLLTNPCVPTDTIGNTWTQAAWGTNNTGFPNQLNIAWAINTTSGADVITSCGAALAGVIAAEIRGTLGTTTDVAGATVVGSSAAASNNSPQLTMTATGDLLVTALYGCTTSGFTYGDEVILATMLGGGACGSLAIVSIPQNVVGLAKSSLTVDVTGNTAWVAMAFKTH